MHTLPMPSPRSQDIWCQAGTEACPIFSWHYHRHTVNACCNAVIVFPLPLIKIFELVFRLRLL